MGRFDSFKINAKLLPTSNAQELEDLTDLEFQTKDLERYDTYRTYKTNHIRNVKELYFDLSKLRTQLGFKNYDINNPE